MNWITDRNPDEPGQYIVCTDIGLIIVVEWYDGWNCSKGSSYHEWHDVVAWMELPDEWITDRNPEENANYIAKTDWGYAQVLEWCDGWNCSPTCTKYEIKDITEWQYLPEVPR